METLSDTIVDDIRRINQQLETSLERGDAAALATLYTADGMLLPAGSDTVQGHSAIAAYWQSVMDQGFRRAELHTVEVDQLGPDSAVELGTYRLTGDNNSPDHGKYIGVWKRENGHWKLQRDIWNSNTAK
ncbi:nuclear transport factor 2 family protein [Hymenobacter koreensis]|uniref:DUF4440 domain-containing protein n=1 Tax=Hymenobacter koreensis TaxID=1084523 RepID=A0ABP8IVH3_9BACT